MNAKQDAQFMARAIRLAGKGRYTSHPNPSVGCVLVRDGIIISEGFTQPAGQAHAEAAALHAATSDVRGATAYVTLEPCSFKGRTPSCAKALIESGISRVVVAMMDPHERNAGAGVSMLEAAGIPVTLGVLSSSVQQQLLGHVKRHTEGRPFVRLKLAMTMDGKTALANGESRWITSSQARRDVQRYRAMSGAIVTGVQTVIDDDPRLTVRPDELDHPSADLASSIERPVYILDSTARIPAGAGLLQRPGTVLVTAARTDRDLPVPIVTLPGEQGRVDLPGLLRELAAREHSEVLFECGATLAGAMMDAELVDELVLYIAPRMIGDRGRSLLNMAEVVRMTGLRDLAISDIRQIGPDIRVTATPAGHGAGR